MSQETLDQLRTVARDNSRPSHGARLRRALLVLAIPVTASFATACYAAAMPEAEHPYEPEVAQEAEVDHEGEEPEDEQAEEPDGTGIAPAG